MIKRFTLADYISTLRLGKRNRQIYFSLYDCGDGKTEKAKQLFGWKKFPFDNETNKIIAQNHDKYIATIDNKNYTNKRWYEAEYSDTCVKIYLSHKRRCYKSNLTIYEIFINDKKCFISTDKLEIELWLQEHKELWLNPNQIHKAFGVIHRAQNNEFENMRIETIVLDAYDKVIHKED
jgi:hypothetical protein